MSLKLKEEYVMWKKGLCFSSVLFAATVLTCVVFFNQGHAAEFSADMVHTTPQGVFHGKFFVKGNDFRQETNMQGQQQIMIYRHNGDTVWMLMPREKMYMEMSNLPQAENVPQVDQHRIEQMAKKKYLGKETVNGYVCEKYQYIYHDKSMGTMTQWFSKKLNFPIKMEMDGPSGHMASEYKNIIEKSVSDSLFEIPAGYEKMPMPGMMQHMPK